MSSKKNEIMLDINDAIEKQLPSQVGDVLKGRLEKLSELEKEYEVLMRNHEDSISKIAKLERVLNTHEEIDKKQKELDKREDEVHEREKRQDVHDANLKAKEAEKRADLSKQYVEMVFKSPVYRQTIQGYTSSREHGGNFDKTTTEVVE